MVKKVGVDVSDHEYRFGVAGGSVMGQDLNRLLVSHPESTFYLRSVTDQPEFNIQMGDVLIVDRSLTPRRGNIVVITDEDSFKVARFSDKSEIWGVITHIIHKMSR